MSGNWDSKIAGVGESTNVPSQNSCSSSDGSNDAGDFECNICFELAQDPIVTLCGHLYCWPCLYRWLHHHSHSRECPVCKAFVEEEKLVPLYGRGKIPTNPRSKTYPEIGIPQRPAGQRPETAPQMAANNFTDNAFGFTWGFMPMASARMGNFTLSTAFGGLIPALFNIHFHGFPDATAYGSTSGYQNAFNAYNGGRANSFAQPASQSQQADNVLMNLLLLVGFLAILALLCW